jgi:hypothetical protein
MAKKPRPKLASKESAIKKNRRAFGTVTPSPNSLIDDAASMADIDFGSRSSRRSRAVPQSVGTITAPLAEIARKVSKRMNDLGLNSIRLAFLSQDAAEELDQLFPERGYKNHYIDEAKIRHLLMAAVPKPKPTATRVAHIEFLEILAHALRVPPDFLLGSRTNRNPIYWDPILDTDLSDHIKNLMKIHEEQAGEFIGWATFLPCSFETKEFMELHHNAMYAHLSPDHKPVVVAKFNSIGNSRRLKLFNDNRRYTFTVLICRSILDQIANGMAEYKLISSGKRKSSLEHLQTILKDHSSKGINLIVANDTDVQPLVEDMGHSNGMIVMGDEYTQWTFRRGDVYWSEHSEWIQRHRRWINQFVERSAFRSPSDVDRLLSELISRMN